MSPDDVRDRMAQREGRRDDPGAWSATGRRGVVATAHWLATAAGARMLDRGGNAFDAAIAASVALGVCEPAGSGLCGMGLLVAHDAATGRTFTVEGPCRAPALATPDTVRDRRRDFGGRAVAVPGLPALLAHVHARYASLPLEVLLAPAIELAEAGPPVTPFLHGLLVRYGDRLARHSGARLVLAGDGAVPAAGTALRQPALARTLRRLSTDGFEDLYGGATGRALAADLERQGSLVRAADLASPPPAREGKPLRAEVMGRSWWTLPPPGGGRTFLQMLQTWDALGSRQVDPDEPRGALLVAGVICQARADRRRQFQDGDDGLALRRNARDHAARAAERIVQDLDGPGETSHLSVLDAAGNGVALTQSLERSFGARSATPALGLWHNGYLRTFKVDNERHPHLVRPGAPARSNASPTLASTADGIDLAIGSTGSERLASALLQVVIRLGRGDPFSAVAAPRIHASPEGVVRAEAGRMSAATLAALEDRGYAVVPLAPWAFEAGGLQLALRNGDAFVGVADPRRDGAAAAPGEQDHG